MTHRETAYSSDEQRVANWLVARASGMIGAGDDPIGFVLTSYELLQLQLDAAVNLLAQRDMNCAGCWGLRGTPDQYPGYLQQARDDVAQAVNQDVAEDGIPQHNKQDQL